MTIMTTIIQCNIFSGSIQSCAGQNRQFVKSEVRRKLMTHLGHGKVISEGTLCGLFPLLGVGVDDWSHSHTYNEG